MASLVRQIWDSDGASGLSRRDRRSCAYDAYLPDRLADRRFTMDGDVAADVADAGGCRLLRAEMASVVGDEARDVTATEVLGNIEAMRWATQTSASAPRFDVDDICGLHHRLLEGTRHEHLGGVIRTEQNWIGGSSYNPCFAAFVPPPPDIAGPSLRRL